MRVLLVVGMVAGGAGRHVHDLSRELHARGHRVIVAAPASVLSRDGFAEVADEVVPVEITDRPDPRADLSTVRTLRPLARRNDVVHAHGMRAAALTGVAGVGTRLPPIVATLHNAAPTARGAAAVFGALGRWVARRAAAVLVVSPDLEATLRGWGARRVLPAVVAAPAAPVPDEQAAAALRVQLAGDDLLAVTVGRLAPQKRLDVLLDAAHALGADAGVRFVIAGAGPLEAALAERIRTEGLPVRLLGHRDDVPALLAAADLVVSSADWEGQPVWLQQAAAAGAPMVSTDTGGTRRMLGEEGASWVPGGDAAALAERLRRVVADGDLRARMRRRSLTAAAALPDTAAAADAAEQVYADVRTDAANDAGSR